MVKNRYQAIMKKLKSKNEEMSEPRVHKMLIYQLSRHQPPKE